MNYKIYSHSGEFITTVEVDETTMENLSSDNAEGHFEAGRCDDITAAGVDANQTVYAICA